MAVTREQNYDIALNGQGFILTRDPESPAIQAGQDEIFGNRFAQGDRDYTDFSQWWYWAQTDFTLGIKEEGLWADDAQYKESRNVDPFTVGGEVTLALSALAQITTLSNAADITVGTYGQVSNANGSTTETAFYIGTNGDTVDGSNGAKVWKSTDGGNNWSEVLEDVNIQNVRDLFIAGDDAAGGASFLIMIFNGAVHKYDGTTVTDISGNMGSSAYGCGVYFENKLLIWTGLGGTPKLQESADFGATGATTKITYRGGSSVFEAKVHNGKVYYLLRKASLDIELRTWDGTNDVLIKTFRGFDSLTSSVFERKNRNLVVSPSGTHLFIFLRNATSGTINASVWTIDTNDVITQVYKDVADDVVHSAMAIVSGNQIHFGNLIIEDLGSGIFAFHGGIRNAADNAFYSPIAANGKNILYVNAAGHADDIKIYRTSTFRYTTGFIVTSEFGIVSGIDKLFYSINFEFKALVAGQSIQVEYSSDQGSSWTSMGTASFAVDGGSITSKTLYFGDAIILKKVMLRFTLTRGTTETTTPTWQSFSVEYIPIPDYRLNWKFQVKCQNEITLKPGIGLREPKSALHLRNLLRNSWWTKSILTFEDYDAMADLTLNGALNATAVTIPVNETTDNFSERGRILINNEEIFYNGKNKTSFLNCVRGSRGTLAAAHLDDDVISTAHRVMITNYSEELILANDPTEAEYLVSLELRETL